MAAGLLVLPGLAGAQLAAERGVYDPLEQGRLAFAGYGDVTYVDPDGGNSAFKTKIAPIILVQLNDRIHIETEVEISVDENGETETELEYADIHYFMTDSTTVTAGKFLLPFGQFGPNLHPSWINSLPSVPVVYGGHDGNGIASPLLPILSDNGVAFQKTFVFGNGSRLFFDAYVINGPQSAVHDEEGDDGHDEEDEVVDEHDEEPTEEGHAEEGAEIDDHDEEAEGGHADSLFPEVDFEATSGDNNDDKAFGGRMAYAWLPEFELGLSYYSGAYDNNSDLDFTAYGVDLNYVSTYFTVRGEYIETETESFDDHGDKQTFDRDGWYLQGSWRLKQTGVDFLAPVELVIQRSEVNKFEGSERWAYGINYWLTPNAVFKLSIDETELDTGEDQTRFLVQIAYGF
ncbi:MAG: porin [Gammaproteobacteria bacterium]|nr:porin [Gammaproteobacteria bacterium]